MDNYKRQNFSQDPIVRCFVLECKNKVMTAPEKRFFRVPSKKQAEWCNVFKRRAVKGSLYICEDHLILEDDLANYNSWRNGNVTGRLKPEVPERLRNMFSNKNADLPTLLEDNSQAIQVYPAAMGICCVDGCQTGDKDDVTYFPFPIKPTLKRKWREAIKTSTKIHDDSKVCSRHFSEGDYEEVRGKLRLKGRVVPSIFEGQPPPTPKSPPDTNGTGEVDSPPSQPTNEETNKQTTTDSEKEPSKDSDKDSKNLDKITNEDDKSNNDKESNQEDFNHEFSEEFSEETVDEKTDGADDSAERCTIECVPEAILHQDSDSHDEADLHKEDIEDIIANYHIKQNKELAERLKASQEAEAQKEKEKEKEKEKSEKENVKVSKEKSSKKKEQRPPDKENGDVIEIEADPIEDTAPSYIEISVGGASAAKSGGDDCLMVLENVEVDLDPSSFMMSDDDHDAPKKDGPISLLTSSDDEDCILQEPHVDTVEVSDETDEDDVPLVRLVDKFDDQSTKPDLGRIFWGNLYEYYCYQCKFKTKSKAELKIHKEKHLNGSLDAAEETVIQVCDTCNFATASKTQFLKHKKKHRDEKRFKCHLCEYKAKHKMSLIYHLKSHEGVTVEAFMVNKDKKNNCYKCSDCKFFSNNKSDMLKHVRTSCVKLKKRFKCSKCQYSTKRRSDLTRHMNRHKEKDIENDVDYSPDDSDDD